MLGKLNKKKINDKNVEKCKKLCRAFCYTSVANACEFDEGFPFLPYCPINEPSSVNWPEYDLRKNNKQKSIKKNEIKSKVKTEFSHKHTCGLQKQKKRVT